jgi:ribosomal protein S12 methylthiotransferase accessory factor YcaO
VTAVLATIEQPVDAFPKIVFAGAADLCPRQAVFRALVEGVQCWLAVAAKRPDRTPSDPRRLNREGRILWWADPARRSALDWLWQGPRSPLPPEPGVDPSGAASDLTALLAWFDASGYEVLAVDLAGPALARRLGIHVVAAVCPDLHPLYLDERRPALWSRRLEERLRGAPINTDPHPYP